MFLHNITYKNPLIFLERVCGRRSGRGGQISDGERREGGRERRLIYCTSVEQRRSKSKWERSRGGEEPTKEIDYRRTEEEEVWETTNVSDRTRGDEEEEEGAGSSSSSSPHIHVMTLLW